MSPGTVAQWLERSPVEGRVASSNLVSLAQQQLWKFQSSFSHKWPHRIRVNSPVFQADNTGSSPVGAIRLMNEVEYPSGLRREPAKLLFVGSNPTSTSQSVNHLVHGSIAQLAEQRPLKANVAGSTPATPTGYPRLHRLVVRTPLCQGGDGGSIPPGAVVRFNGLGV